LEENIDYQGNLDVEPLETSTMVRQTHFANHPMILGTNIKTNEEVAIKLVSKILATTIFNPIFQ
jgi:hypothetical protein